MAKVKRNTPLEGETWDLSLGVVQHSSRWGTIARTKGSTLRYYPDCPWEKGPKAPPWPEPTPVAVRVAIWLGSRPFCGPPPPPTCLSGPSAYAEIIIAQGSFWNGQLLSANATCHRVKPPDGSPSICKHPSYGVIVRYIGWTRAPWGTCEYQLLVKGFRGQDPAIADSQMGSPGGLTLVGVWNQGVPPRHAVPWWLYPEEYGEIIPDCT